MPIYLDTQGNPTLGIGICDRCARKFPIGELHRDPNSPGLRVCIDDKDEYDPYRLPARQPEKVTLAFVRPDVSLATNPSGFIDEAGNEFFIEEDANVYLKP